MAETRTTAAAGLPSDIEVLDNARGALSEARDWLNSDTADSVAGERLPVTGQAIRAVMRLIGEAKGEIDGAKGDIYRADRR